ncbi:energy transducer TonB [Campylobacter fetus]|uniref:energy transducer TonB n=1 Tax=Campylobacter fetus TaxID=196 RepID=UPI000FCA1BA8|nr:energy transducer TonB [Campylobacter fetus]RUT51226.1 energy transducer TonB [Campylobacter fetus]RUT51953.1 energy transducer TonB [Campylobacter fetus]
MNSFIGFFISLLLHAGLIFGFILLNAKDSADQIQNEQLLKLTFSNLNSLEDIPKPYEEVFKPIIEEKKEVDQAPQKKIIEKKIEQIYTKKIIKHTKPDKKQEQTPKKQIVQDVETKQMLGIDPNLNSVTQNSIEQKIFDQNTNQNKIEQQPKNTINENMIIGTKIRNVIANYARKNYPNSARRKRQTGIVKVSFMYKANGEVTNVKIDHSSTYMVLNEAVLTAIQKTKSKFPSIKNDTNFQIEVEFSLS